MREILAMALILLAGILWTRAEAAELPAEIAACITDTECERAAADLCDEGRLAWCNIDTYGTN